MKKRLTVILTFISCVMAMISVFGADYQADVVVSLQLDNPIMEVNGVQTEIDAGRGTTPLIINDRTMVPIRAIVEAFGGDVSWEENTKSVILSLKNDTIKLVADSDTAYLNGGTCALDVAPTVINDRTMMPVRFIAESFNLGVAWSDGTKTVTIVRNEFEDEEYEYLMGMLSDYSGQPYVTINNNIPMFKEYEKISGSFEFYGSLDEFGRCDVTMASVAPDIMPTADRESISKVKPTGWINKKYDVVSGGYLYNRCHLIGYQLTGENANERNLITGTRYLNIEGMLPFENAVDDYVDKTGNHVMYRVTPVFTGDNLVADGVLMEAYSVEDNGDGIRFCVFCYNVQPSIFIDYATGDNWLM